MTDSAPVRTLSVAAAVLTLMFAACPSRADSIDDYIHQEMINQRIPGLALGVTRDGKPVKVQTYGLANVELNAPVTPDTVFRLASLSKQFIASAVMLLVTEGKINLGDSVCLYLKNCPESWRPITIRDALSHTAGLAHDAPGYNPLEIVSVDSGADVIRRAYSVPLLSKPGEKWAYSNLGYAVLAETVSAASGKPWPQFIEERIFSPTGMGATQLTDAIKIVPRRANGYLFRDARLQNVLPLIALRPAGAFLSTLTDLIKWDAALTSGKVIPQAIQDQMWAPVTLTDGSSTHYGFGWRVDEESGHRRVHHGGSNLGWRAESSRFVDDRIDVIVLANGEGARADVIALEVAGHYIAGLSPQRKMIALSPRDLAAYAGDYQASPSDTLTIAVDGSGLSIQSSEGGAEMKMLPETPSVFFISKDESYVFTRDGDKVTQLEIRFGTATVVGATELKARRLP